MSTDKNIGFTTKDLRASVTHWSQDVANVVLKEQYDAVIEFITWLENKTEELSDDC